MSEKILQVLVALAALISSCSGHFNVQPQYQVSIMWEFHPGNPIHLCNGIIIYERLIATPASCVYYKFGPKDDPKKLDPSVLSIVAGSTNTFTEALRINVSSIDVADNFDPETLENDLALLKLSKSLPLGTRPDMKWIMLDDNQHVNHSCLVNFFSRNPKSALPNYYQTEELSLFDNRICRNSTKHPKARKDDLCSIYVLPQQFDCVAAHNFLSFNNDRGSGLVCRGYLVGLLSSVVTRPDPKNNCTDVTLRATYTNVSNYLMWIYSAMMEIDTEYISTPYDASVNMLVTNTSYKNEFEVLTTSTTTAMPITVIGMNSTAANATATNGTVSANGTTTNGILTNGIGTNGTSTNGTVTNGTATNGTATANLIGTRPFIVTNSTGGRWNRTTTNWNSTVTNWNTTATNWNSTALNQTSPSTNSTGSKPPVPAPLFPYNNHAPTTAPTTASTSSYFKHPLPTIRNFFGSGAASIQLSLGCLLIAAVSLRLIIYR